jgi:hypothetical protein
MKRLLFAVCAVVLALMTQATSCEKDPKNAPVECGDIACTMMFAMVTVEVKDQQGNKVILDEYYTIREKTNDKLTLQSHMPDSGTYTVLDDNFVATLKNASEQFRFVGKKNGVEVVNEQYTISADCCHINKVNGKSTVTIP